MCSLTLLIVQYFDIPLKHPTRNDIVLVRSRIGKIINLNPWIKKALHMLYFTLWRRKGIPFVYRKMKCKNAMKIYTFMDNQAHQIQINAHTHEVPSLITSMISLMDKKAINTVIVHKSREILSTGKSVSVTQAVIVCPSQCNIKSIWNITQYLRKNLNVVYRVIRWMYLSSQLLQTLIFIDSSYQNNYTFYQLA
jgi:hypothetical protein